MDVVTLSPQQLNAIAMASLGGDVSARGVAHFGGLDTDEAVAVLVAARGAGVLHPDGTLGSLTQAQLIAELSDEVRTRVHTRAAQGLLAEGPQRLPEALHHLAAAAALTDAETAIDLADNAGRLSLSLGDYASAASLLALAAKYDMSTDLSRQGHRLCDLAAAVDGLGDLEQARRHAARAVALGELAGDASLMARAAVAHTLPVDWYAGDQRTHGLLERANSMPLDHTDRVAVTAARALAEMRIPVITGEHHQVAWVTRPAVAQPLADQALDGAANCSPWVQCLATLAWRSTHRAPQFLDRRRDLSAQALALAQTTRTPSFHVEAAVWLAVDAVESGDRELFDEALSAAQWVARRDGNPRLKFRAFTLAMGAAMLDGNHERVRGLLGQTTDLLRGLDASLQLVVQTLFGGQLALAEDDSEALAAMSVEPTDAVVTHPLGRSAAAYVWACDGRVELAVEHTRRALTQRDAESSLLLVGTRAAAVASQTGDEDLCHQVIDILNPYADHVAVDSNGWWCDGPVAGWLAMVYHRLGQQAHARRHLHRAEPVARALGDVRSLRRLEALRHELPVLDPSGTEGAGDLSDRELRVLAALATGATNAAIAHDLAYSVSTIRNDTIAIYRKLGVQGRPDAVAVAISRGLISPDN